MQHFRGWQIGLLYVVSACFINLKTYAQKTCSIILIAVNVADMGTAVMELIERAAVSDADDDAVGQFLL